MTGASRASLAIACTLAAAVVSAQKPVTFRSEAKLVVLQTTVKNARGELVTDLPREAFTVFEDGKRQPIALFRNDDVPVSIRLLIDNSGSMRAMVIERDPPIR